MESTVANDYEQIIHDYLPLAIKKLCVLRMCISCSQNNGGMQCPGCDNIFYSVNSLRVHLSEDHNVAPEELENIISTFNSNISGGNTAPSCDKTPTLVKDWGKQSSVHSEAVQNIKGASNNGTVYIQDKSSIKTVQDQRKVSAVVLQGTSQVVLSKNLGRGY